MKNRWSPFLNQKTKHLLATKASVCTERSGCIKGDSNAHGPIMSLNGSVAGICTAAEG